MGRELSRWFSPFLRATLGRIQTITFRVRVVELDGKIFDPAGDRHFE